MSNLRFDRRILHHDSRDRLRRGSSEFGNSHQKILSWRKQWTPSQPDTTATVEESTDPTHALTVPTATTTPVKCASSPAGTSRGSSQDSRPMKLIGKPTEKTQATRH